jgi:hypothetical protein
MPAIMKEWQSAPNYFCMEAILKSVKRMERPLQSHWFGRRELNSGLLCAALSVPTPIAYIWNPNLLVKGMKHATSTTDTQLTIWN